MKSYFFEFAFFWAIFLLLSSESLSVGSGSSLASPSASHGHSDENMSSAPSSPRIPASPPLSPSGSFGYSDKEEKVPKSKLITFHKFPPSEDEGTSRKRPRESGMSSLSSSDRSLTPISDTDSAQSPSKQYTSGTKEYHEKGYNFYHHMAKYHKVIGKAYEDRTGFYDRNHYVKPNDHNTELHSKAYKSSIAKKVKHRKDYQGIKKGNLQPGPIQNKKSMNKVPQIPTREVADQLVNSRKIVFRSGKGKGYKYLTAKRLPYGQRRPRERDDMWNSSSSSEAE